MKRLLMLFFLIGCVGPQTMSRIDSSVGMEEKDLINLMGAPSDVVEAGGYKIYRYIKNRGITSSTVPVGYLSVTTANVGFEEFDFFVMGSKVIKSEYTNTSAKTKYRSKTGW